ncbi:hypothetical protein SASPL_126905 [Salvia splendens]|uniref:Uncharacterized protein n=1 Tax=Salvia splendens TaxID=180675 RepID=A0A8X8XJV9_SALSN|nr:hypothetical protein SASPL_126905 [Salvia splendens]
MDDSSNPSHTTELSPEAGKTHGTTSTENIIDNHGSIFDELQSPVGGSLFDSDSDSSEDEDLEPASDIFLSGGNLANRLEDGADFALAAFFPMLPYARTG